MAKLNIKRTDTLRVDPDFKKFVIDLSRMKSYQEKDKITPSRITQAMYNQWKKYPELENEFKKSKLGRWKSS